MRCVCTLLGGGARAGSGGRGGVGSLVWDLCENSQPTGKLFNIAPRPPHSPPLPPIPGLQGVERLGLRCRG